VFLTARNEALGRAAVGEAEVRRFASQVSPAGITDEASIKSLAVFLKQNYDGLDVLVNNASILYRPGDTTAPFAEQAVNTINVNFFGTLNVCLHLFPLLRPHARVVHMSSNGGYLCYLGSEDIRNRFRNENLTEEELCDYMREFMKAGQEGTHEAKGWGYRPYSVSKIGINALTIIQQKKFLEDEREDIVVNAVHPGYVMTDINQGKGELTPEQGAEAPVYLALLPRNVESPRGQFVLEDKTVASWTT
ncbi:carbonyl reductase 1, partial [Caerostris extrusa]